MKIGTHNCLNKIHGVSVSPSPRQGVGEEECTSEDIFFWSQMQDQGIANPVSLQIFISKIESQ